MLMWKRNYKSGSANFENVPVHNLNFSHSCGCVGGFRIYREPSGSVNVLGAAKVSEGAKGG